VCGLCVHGDALTSSPARLKHQTGNEGDIISPAELSSSSCRPPRPIYLEEIFDLTKIDRWFLTQIKEIIDFEKQLAVTKNQPFHV
jgi:hypothetical protein